MSRAMNQFKVEFSQLLQRYTPLENTNNNNSPIVPTSLSNQQILDAIHDVLRSTLNINLQRIEEVDMKTPANEILVTTPCAPDVLKFQYSEKLSNDSFTKLPNLCLFPHESQEMTETSDNKTSEDEKTIDNKSETIKSDKSEQGPKDTKEMRDSFNQTFKKELLKTDFTGNNQIHCIIEDARKHTVTVLNKLVELKELLTSETRPIRRLSALISQPSLKQQQQQQNQQHHQLVAAGNQLRTIQRVKVLRRSIASDDVSVTPTSRLSLAPLPPKKQTSTGSNSNSSSSNAITRSTSKAGLGQHNRSVSALSLTNASYKSAGSSGAAATVTKSPSKCTTTKNSKYAHVQSTIPKSTCLTVKRKVQ